MLAPSYQCNLSCAHCCVPIEWPDRLSIPTALRFLEDAWSEGVSTLGFTGGEPFLYPEFVLTLTRRAAELGFRFDKVISNGVWYEDEPHLESVLRDLARAGFSGKLGLSVDKFHGSHTEKAASFCRVARRVFNRDNIISLSYASRHPDQGLEPVRHLARALDAVLDWSDLLGRYLLVSRELTLVLNWNHLAPVERAERFSGAWDGTWFEEDYCEGPGQALIVTPRGEVKPCCGFASDLDQLTIGNIHHDSVRSIIRRARRHPYVGKVFREGLTAIRAEIQTRDPRALPAATSNHCFFCWYVLSKNLVNLPAGAGGAAQQGRMSLPMAGIGPSLPAASPGETTTALLMAFDGRTVFLGREPTSEMPLEKGRVYLVNLDGPAPVEPPKPRMTWTEYQSWIDRLREEGYKLTTHTFSPCRK
jgi:MoaA/NifB/PqqE/SkfB family radical SAM enzyme